MKMLIRLFLTTSIAIFLFFSSQINTANAQAQGLAIGQKCPEILLPSPSGDTIALSSLRNKIVLIDFWATWCAPCVEEQSDLAIIYKKFAHADFTRGKGFEIYGVSLDAKKANWVKGISQKKIVWIQVSDLKFWRSPVAKAYDIQELPFNVLIDGHGIILAKNLHGKELEEEIAKYLTK